MILYRPVGQEELGLIYDSGRRVFPPRLPEQPIFYPVLTLAYAKKIALEWNATACLVLPTCASAQAPGRRLFR
jgi:hypothetical protein